MDRLLDKNQHCDWISVEHSPAMSASKDGHVTEGGHKQRLHCII